MTNPIADIPEHVGYLKELGLDYGWGTSTPMQFVLESIHIHTGLPWYATAMVTAFLLRAVLFNMTAKNSHAMAKMAQLKPQLEPLQEAHAAARAEGDQFKQAQIQKDMMALRRQTNMKLSNLAIPLVAQITLGFGIWRNLRGMSSLPIPALERESFLWMHDLSVRDSTFGIAFLQAFAMYFSFRVR